MVRDRLSVSFLLDHARNGTTLQASSYHFGNVCTRLFCIFHCYSEGCAFPAGVVVANAADDEVDYSD